MPGNKEDEIDLFTPNFHAFIDAVDKLRSEWDFKRDDVSAPWFRGQQKKHWKLIPSIVRLGCGDSEAENSIREEFATRAPALRDSGTLPNDEWDLYFLMQHYGAPTRLLDWTESPTIALYFAVRDNPGYYDSAVWALDPYEMNKRVIRKGEVISPSALGVSGTDRKKVAPWLPTRWSKQRLPKRPLAVFPTHIARRISSQKSCFTIHGSDDSGLLRFGQGTNACLRRIVVPGYAVRNMRLDLQNYGIDDTTIFPDLEGLGRALVARYRDLEPDAPHRGVYVRLKPSKLDKGGVGVFAIRRIPPNTKLFTDENEELCWIPEDDLPTSQRLRRLYDDFAIIKDGRYGCPTSFNRLTPAWFLNESKLPNTRCDENYDFYTLREIGPGEELTVDYSTFSEYPESSNGGRGLAIGQKARAKAGKTPK